MAGLPYNISLLLRDDSISYIRRAFQHRLNPIDLDEVELSMRKTVELAGRRIDSEALVVAAKGTGGFPFMIQLVGYQMWRQSPENKTIRLPDAEAGIRFATADMERMIFEATLRELSRRDMDFLLAMTEDDGVSKMAEIAGRMGASITYAGQYRLRLIEQGIIGDRGTGKVGFEVPMLREYLLERYKGQ
jgi:hypothetical protein